jgi:hypothetical protein
MIASIDKISFNLEVGICEPRSPSPLNASWSG